MENTLNKKELASELSDQLQISKKDAANFVNALFNTMAERLEAGDTIDINGFGKFVIAERAARQGVNPFTKEKITIAASKGVKFKPAKALKDAVNK